MREVLALNGLRKLGKTSLWIRISFNDILNNDNQNTPNVLRLHVLSYFKVRMCEHLGISALTGKRVKGDNDSAIKKKHLLCNHSPGFNDFFHICQQQL